MLRQERHVRVLMYSHDTFGLGHLRRTREIAHALVDQFKKLDVLIVCGSSIAGAFNYRARVDFIKVPSVIKLYNGEYTSLSRHIDLAETLELRRGIIRHSAEIYRPDIFIVDKEARGLRGELDPTLSVLRRQGCHIVLGLRDVLDSPDALEAEWRDHDVVRCVDTFYDEIWVYGARDFWNPLQGLPVPRAIEGRVVYTGYLARKVPKNKNGSRPKLPEQYILVTAGGGGDGADLMRQVLAAREHDPANDFPLLLVLGPFMPKRDRGEIRQRARNLKHVLVCDFDSAMERTVKQATAVVAMGGYNTFCEIISFDKRALLIPRTEPRSEQLIRARRAAESELLDMLDPDHAADPGVLAAALRRLPCRPLPSQCSYEVDLGGLDRIGELVMEAVRARARRAHIRVSA